MKTNHLNINFMKTRSLFASALLCLTLFTSCSDDDENPAEVIEEELITNVKLTFTNNDNATDVVVLSSDAPDGQDGESQENVMGTFTTGATYTLSLALNADDEDVLNEDIIPEADEHFFVYAVNGVNLTMTRDDNDVAGPDESKLGVNTTWVAGAPSTGNLQISLIHEPESVNDSNGFGSTTGGSEDINITFTGVAIN